MINIEVEVKVNGSPVKVSGKLNDLVAWFITQKLVAEDSSVASFSAPQKSIIKTPKKHFFPRWTEEQQNRLIERVKAFELQGLKDGAISKTIQSEFGRTPVALNLTIYRFRKAGQLSRVNPNN